jgi:hypothetical protein
MGEGGVAGVGGLGCKFGSSVLMPMAIAHELMVLIKIDDFWFRIEFNLFKKQNNISPSPLAASGDCFFE